MLNILVTGAAGLIGGEVCARLSARGHSVTALVRRNKVVRSNDGQIVPVERLATGDICAPLMGLSPADHNIDVVVHAAASLEFDAPWDELQAINVEGTRNAIAFARACKASFLQVSTAYVCGRNDGLIAEASVPANTQFANGYEASKAAAERVVEESGLPFAIARPSVTLGDQVSGQIREFPSLCNVFRLMARGKVAHFPASADATLDMVPIDHVAEGIARIASRMNEANRRYFHLVCGNPLSAAELAHGVARINHFPNPQVVAPDAFDTSSLSGRESRVMARMLKTFGSYFRRDPRFNDSETLEFLDMSRPKADRAWLDGLIQYAIEVGYLPAPVTAHQDNDVPIERVLRQPIESPL